MGKDKSQKVTAASLPLDVLVYIFQFLDAKNKGKAAQVCTSWKEATNYKTLWKDLGIRLASANLNTESEQSIIQRGIKRFDVSTLEQRAIAFLRRVPDMEYLRFAGCREKQYLLETLTTKFSFPENSKRMADVIKGDSVELDSIYTDIHAYRLKLQASTSVSCQNSNGHLLKTITPGMKKLKVLHLSGCLHSYDNAGNINEIEFFAGADTSNQLTSLLELSLKYINFHTEQTFEYISKTFVNLVSLNFDKCWTGSEKGFAYLTRLEKLMSLRISRMYGITDEVVDHISRISNLKYLELGRCANLTEKSLESISRLPYLVILNLNGFYLQDSHIKHIHKLPHLRELGFKSSGISDVGLFYLATGNLKLTKLDLSHSLSVGDEGFLNICNSSFVLRDLNLTYCKITDKAVNQIVDNCPYLESLDLTECWFVSRETRRLVGEKLRGKKNFKPQNIEKDNNPVVSDADQLASYLESLIDVFWR